MAGPSDYELDAWHRLQQFKGRPLSRLMGKASDQVAGGAAEVGRRATRYWENHPAAQSAVSRGQEVVAKGARAIGTGARRAADALPNGVADWRSSALGSVRRMVARASRVGLSADRVVSLHRRRGHDVTSLLDLRRLDLQQIDVVRGRRTSLYYPAIAAISGAGAGLVISGGELVTTVSAGASAAPSGAAIAGAFVADAATVLGLASRAVGHVSLFYGFDPEDAGEKLFAMSVVNVGTAMSASAKAAAMADISRLTQALVRGKTLAVLDKSLVTQVYKQFAKAFGVRYTKQSLGKVVPAVGIVLGGSFNWATLEAIVDGADTAYRRRFLLEKYPHLAFEDALGSFPEEVPDDEDEAISVLGELAEAGGPNLR
jgi:EcsC protein family